MAAIALVWLFGFAGVLQRTVKPPQLPPTSLQHLENEPAAEPQGANPPQFVSESKAPTRGAGPRPFQSPPHGTQQSDAQLKVVWDELNDDSQRRKNLLVFGLGMDSDYFANVANKGGKTVFIEDNPEWISKVTQKVHGLSVARVTYKTVLNRDRERYKDPATWGELYMSDLPQDVLDTPWDVIIVDAPNGCCDWAPPEVQANAQGRYQSIYLARWLAQRHPRRGGTLVTVDDCERKVESLYGALMLGESNQTAVVARRAFEHGSDGQPNKQCYFRV